MGPFDLHQRYCRPCSVSGSATLRVPEVLLSDESAWIALAGALGGVVLAGGLSLATATLNHRWSEEARVRAVREQDTQVMRDQAREACHNYLVATNSFYQAIDEVYRRMGRAEKFDQHEHVRVAITALQDAYVYLTISAGAEARKSYVNTTSLFMSYEG